MINCCQLRTGFLSVAIVATVFRVVAASASAVECVDPMIGTDGWGSTFPGPVWPMGMIQPGPDTAVNPKTGDYGSSESGYSFRSNKLLGFTQTHVSGMGCCDMQDFLLLPFVGEMPSTTNRMLVTIDKRTEKASPGYYAVEYADQPVKAELTCSRRVAYHRYTFTKGGRVHVFIDMQAGPLAWWRKNEPNYPKSRVIASEGTATTAGVVEARNVVTCWENNRDISCHIEFSPRPVAVRELAENGRAGKRWVMDFDIRPGSAVIAKVSISGVDIEGARANFADDPKDFDFDARRKACRDAWQALLSRVRATGSEEQLRIFYSSLYHAYVHPNLLSDADGRVRFFDSMAGDAKRRINRVTRANGFEAYTNFSEWDTFRAAHPLHTIVTPELVDAFVRSRLLTYQTVGTLPKFQLFGGETYCMIGMHTIPMITDAVLKGLTSADAKELLAAEVASIATLRDNAEYDRLGYIPMVKGGSVSRTLEWGIDDWAIAKLAEHVGDGAMADLAMRRAQYYRNLYDPSTGCMRARGRNGEWRTPFDVYKQRPTDEDRKAGIPNDYTEGGAWQYAGHVLQDVDGLVALHGGVDGFVAFLEKVFSDCTVTKYATGECSGRIGQFALGNEHDQHMPYLWQYANRPDRTAEIVRELCEKYYSAKPDGICGNEDCGQMSAWYLFACMGFYPVNPCGGAYVTGAPQLPRIELKLANGRTFTIIAKNLSRENLYVKSVMLNGKPLSGFLLNHADIMSGGELVFEMTNRTRAKVDAAIYVSAPTADALAAAVGEARRTGVRTICLKGGVYSMLGTLDLDCRDDGLELKAAPGERPILDGGLRLENGVRGADGLVTYDLAAAGFKHPKIPFRPFGLGITGEVAQVAVYRAGVALEEAREPDEDFTGVTEVLNASNFVFRAIVPGAEALVGQKGLVAHGYFTWGWADYTLPVEVRRDDKGLVYDIGMTEALPTFSNSLNLGRPFRLKGSRSFVDTDGECFYDRANGTVTVRDVPGELIVTACTEPLLRVSGTRGLRFEGLTFRHGCGSGIVATGTVDFVLSNCLVEKFGLNGVELLEATRAKVERNVFRTFGSSGLVLTGGDRATLRRGDNLVCDNDLSGSGCVIRSGTHVIVTHGIGNTFVHNNFHDMPGAAVRLDGNDHVFASNVLERCVQEADDWGAVENYGSPFFRGIRIFHNVFRNIGGVSKWNTCGQCGVRFDDAVSGMCVYGNRFINSSRGHFGAVQTHGGKENVVENNLFIGCHAMLSVTTWSDEHWLEWWARALDPKRDPVNPFSPVWGAAYGDLRRLKYAPRRHTLRRNILVGDGTSVLVWGPGRVDLTMEGNTFVRAGTSLSNLLHSDADMGSYEVAEGALFDPLPDESLLGARIAIGD